MLFCIEVWGREKRNRKQREIPFFGLSTIATLHYKKNLPKWALSPSNPYPGGNPNPPNRILLIPFRRRNNGFGRKIWELWECRRPFLLQPRTVIGSRKLLMVAFHETNSLFTFSFYLSIFPTSPYFIIDLSVGFCMFLFHWLIFFFLCSVISSM